VLAQLCARADARGPPEGTAREKSRGPPMAGRTKLGSLRRREIHPEAPRQNLFFDFQTSGGEETGYFDPRAVVGTGSTVPLEL